MDEIIIELYNPEWPEMFNQEAAFLRNILPRICCERIEHFGSTAVHGMSAKPIIDILMQSQFLEIAIEQAVPILENHGYSFWSDNPEKDRLFLVKGLPPNGPRTHHLHIIEKESKLWDRLQFRDYLRTHHERAKQYEQLKIELAKANCSDREAYTNAKTEFINQVMYQINHDTLK